MSAVAVEPQRRFAVVSWSGAQPLHLSPRGQRTEAHLRALGELGEVERVGAGRIPQWLGGDSSRRRSSTVRRLARGAVAAVLVDKYEPGAWRALRDWRPEVDAAVLVGFPWAPLPLAAGRLAAAGIPYVVDIGDPWILTNPHPTGSPLRRWRARRQERRLWRDADGVIVTTAAQGEALRALFPQLRVLVRPNGYTAAESPAGAPPPPRSDELRLVHYGSLYGERVDVGAFCARLRASGRWRRITLVQYGPDWEGLLDPAAAAVDVDRRSARPWPEILAEAPEFDAALVIGWADPAKLPSKAVQYLTLPIPRLALATSAADSLGRYVADKPGWATVGEADPNPASALAGLLAREWSAAELAPPASESWESVTARLGEFAAAAVPAPTTAGAAAS
jgi:hypothetical protein